MLETVRSLHEQIEVGDLVCAGATWTELRSDTWRLQSADVPIEEHHPMPCVMVEVVLLRAHGNPRRKQEAADPAQWLNENAPRHSMFIEQLILSSIAVSEDNLHASRKQLF